MAFMRITHVNQVDALSLTVTHCHCQVTFVITPWHCTVMTIVLRCGGYVMVIVNYSLLLSTSTNISFFLTLFGKLLPLDQVISGTKMVSLWIDMTMTMTMK